MQRNGFLLPAAVVAAALALPGPAHALTATTTGATNVTTTTAYLNGQVFSPLFSAQYRFQVGTTPSLGTNSPARSFGAFTPYSVSQGVTGLTPGTTYYYRVVGLESGLLGVTQTPGATVRFTSQASPPPAGSGTGSGTGTGSVPVPILGGSVPAPVVGGTAIPVSGIIGGGKGTDGEKGEDGERGNAEEGAGTSPAEPASVGTAPKLEQSVAVSRDRGNVTVKLPGKGAYNTLKTGSVIPTGSLVDTRRGSVALTSALPSGKNQTGRFHGGIFKIEQARNGLVNLFLRGPGPSCGKRAARGKASAAARRRPPRRLFGRDKGGRFRTHGRNSHATVRGTRWVVEDRCEGTVTRVTEGAVMVRDFTTKKRAMLRAGERHLARPPR